MNKTSVRQIQIYVHFKVILRKETSGHKSEIKLCKIQIVDPIAVARFSLHLVPIYTIVGR